MHVNLADILFIFWVYMQWGSLFYTTPGQCNITHILKSLFQTCNVPAMLSGYWDKLLQVSIESSSLAPLCLPQLLHQKLRSVTVANRDSDRRLLQMGEEVQRQGPCVPSPWQQTCHIFWLNCIILTGKFCIKPYKSVSSNMPKAFLF